MSSLSRASHSRFLLGALALVAAAACSGDGTVAPTASPDLSRAEGKAPVPSGARYQLQVVNGGVTSGLFPAAGITLNTSDPWRSIAATGSGIQLVNLPTAHPDSLSAGGTWGSGSCRMSSGGSIPDARMNGWNLSNGPYTFAGTWQGEVSVNRDSRTGLHNFYFAGTRTGGDGDSDAGNPNGGQISNIASNRNAVVTSKAADNSVFEIHFSNAGMGFGSSSSPNGAITLASLYGYEIGCASFTIRAVKMS